MPVVPDQSWVRRKYHSYCDTEMDLKNKNHTCESTTTDFNKSRNYQKKLVQKAKTLKLLYANNNTMIL